MLSFVQVIHARSACIIIHGTWAQGESWYQRDGAFFKSVQRTNQELGLVDEVISFAWSGKLSYQCQRQAAESLVGLMQSYHEIILIGHSHGASVAMIASQMLGQAKQVGCVVPIIKKLYALGVPVELDVSIAPDMQVVECCINLFSFGDYIQTVNGAYQRTFERGQKVVNISVTVNGLHPSHGALHDAVVGKDLLKIPEFFGYCDLGNFEHFDYSQPGHINFFDYDLPEYFIESDQKALIELDKKVQWMVTMAFFRKKLAE